MSVADNVATVPRLLGWPRTAHGVRVDELLDLVEPAGRGLPGALPRAALRRGAPARRPRPRARSRPAGDVDGRAVRRARPHHARAAAARAPPHPERGLRKTIIFVTHDIDEAILLGNRIALLRPGGMLAQYDTPEGILTRPADDFVARFIGADRGIKLLALRRLDELPLAPPDGARRARSRAGSTTLRDALSLMITQHARVGRGGRRRRRCAEGGRHPRRARGAGAMSGSSRRAAVR